MSGSNQRVYCAGCGASVPDSESHDWEDCADCGDIYCGDCRKELKHGLCPSCQPAPGDDAEDN